MEVQESRHVSGGNPAHPAFGANPPVPRATGGVDQGGVDVLDLLGGRAWCLIIRVVGDEREVKLGVRAGPQSAEGFEVGAVVAGLGHGEGDEAQRAPGTGADRVDEVDLHLQRLRLLEVLVTVVAVAEVHTDRDIRGHTLNTTHQSGRDLIDRQLRPHRSLQGAELDRDVPLDGDPLMRQPLKRGVEIGEQRLFVGGRDLGQVVGHECPRHRGQRSRVLQLEAHVGRDRPLVLHLLELRK